MPEVDTIEPVEAIDEDYDISDIGERTDTIGWWKKFWKKVYFLDPRINSRPSNSLMTVVELLSKSGEVQYISIFKCTYILKG